MSIKIKEFVYKKTEEADLIMRVYYSEDISLESKNPAVIFYFGGGWQGGTIDHFASQSEFLATKGFVTITPNYRTKSKHNTTPFECVKDAKDALYWVWQHSDELGIDKERIAVGGGSAGGHLAACTSILKSEVFDKKEIYKIPKAMVLFNPVCDTSEKGFGHQRIGNRMLELSPLHNITEKVPPTLVFHGTADITVPYNNAIDFCNKMKELGNECTLIPYDGRGHGFFNKGKTEEDLDYLDTRDKMYEFLNKVI